ncbi:uncharacterized protein TNCT_681121 [Trichonephila clavata]|uniref:Uncharacterized protein n=1 Tax=Trichonephila clavata TaxID=2740835 RepID=A0A8X6KVW0_TRICU|nr:uncharacterized protein TNCT_681121 [Trichonephila clavata]
MNELKQSYCDLPEQVDLKDALEITMNLEEEAQQLELSLQIFSSQFKKENAKNDNQITKNNIKLPDLPLPTFSGKFQEFELFKNQFMNVIGNNSSLNDTQKLCYLNSALKNDASLIQSDQNSFESLMDALRNRYENKRALVDIHISEILSVPKIQRDSRSIASKPLDQLWKRLDRDPKLKDLYTQFIDENLSLDHIEEITNMDDLTSEEGFFLPHHGVLRVGNRTRPLRVVFNGSQKTNVDISLNDVLCKGSVIQDDLFSIMLRARKHAYFFSCDISHMFRQIDSSPSETFSKNSLEKSSE